jgi:transcription elongation factor GreA
MTASNETRLTEEGRKRLAERIRRLREETIPGLESALEGRDEDVRIRVELDMAAGELDRLTHLLERAGSLEDVPTDPNLVQLGDWVTVEDESGSVDRYLIVHAAEAIGDEQRISADSPLGAALLGHRVGEEAVVDAPAGQYRLRVVDVFRG